MIIAVGRKYKIKKYNTLPTGWSRKMMKYRGKVVTVRKIETWQGQNNTSIDLNLVSLSIIDTNKLYDREKTWVYIHEDGDDGLLRDDKTLAWVWFPRDFDEEYIEEVLTDEDFEI